MESIGFPETSVRNYNYSLRNNPDECSSRPDDGSQLQPKTWCGVIVGFIKIGGVKAITYIVQITFSCYVLHYYFDLDKIR